MPELSLPIVDRILLINLCGEDAKRWDIIGEYPATNETQQKMTAECAAMSRSLLARFAESVATDDTAAMNRVREGTKKPGDETDTPIEVSVQELISLQLMCYHDAMCWNIRANSLRCITDGEISTALGYAQARVSLAQKLDSMMAPSLFSIAPKE